MTQTTDPVSAEGAAVPRADGPGNAPHTTVPNSVPPDVSSLDFYALSRPVQDRFLASAAATGVPAVVLFEPKAQSRAFGWLALALLAPVGLLALLVAGFGNLEHPLALQPLPLVVIHGALAGLGAMAVAGHAFARSEARRFPFRLGNYVFPVGVVEAGGAELRIHSFSGLQKLEARGGRVLLRFPSGTFSFALPKEMQFEDFERWVESSKQKFAEALASQNRRDLAVLDPLRDSGFSNPLSSSVAHARPKDRRTLRLGAALVGGALLGGLLFLARNKLGERWLYKAAVETNTSTAYLSYLSRGGKRAEVRSTLLPLAELARARGSLEAVERYSDANPDSAIRPQIDLALREEMLNALGAVRERGTLQAILDFEAAHPKHAFVAAELAQARKAVYAAAIKRYRETSSAGARVQSFFVDLIRFSEKSGPEVQVRFRREVPVSAERADASIRKSAYYIGPSGLPSQYFTKEHARPREIDAARKICEALQAQFSPEILSFVEGEDLEGAGDLPKVERPTLFVTYRPEMSGGYTTQRPRGVYVGVGFMVYTHFEVPGREAALGLKKQSWWLPPDIALIWRDSLTPKQVYDQIARDGLNRYADKLISVLAPPATGGENVSEDDVLEVAVSE